MASNDVKKSLDQFLDGHATEGILTVSTQVTIRSSSVSADAEWHGIDVGEEPDQGEVGG